MSTETQTPLAENKVANEKLADEKMVDVKKADEKKFEPTPVDPVQASDQHGGEIRAEQLRDGKSHQNGHGHAKDGEHHGHGGHGEEDVIPKDLKQPSAAAIAGFAIAVVILMIGLFLIGFIPDRIRVHKADADAKERADALPIVSTTQPSVPLAERDIMLPCDIRANQSTDLYSRATGFLKKWTVDINDRVTAGQELAEIDIPDVDAQLAASKATLRQSQAAVETAKSNLDLAQKTLDRYIEARKAQPGSITEEDFDTKVSMRDQAVAAEKQAEANVGASAADVNRQETLVGFEKIYAPFNGVVTYRGYDVGALINASDLSAGKQLYSIQQTDPLRVFVSVPQAYATQITIGQQADLLVRNYLKTFQGKVTRSTASVDTNTRTMSFQIDFPNPSNELYPGMYGEIRLPVKTHENTLTIPSSALVFNSNGAQVVVVQDDKTHYRKITIGRDLGTELEVTNGLTADDKIDMNPDEQIVENGQVQLMKKDKPTASGDKPEKLAAKD